MKYIITFWDDQLKNNYYLDTKTLYYHNNCPCGFRTELTEATIFGLKYARHELKKHKENIIKGYKTRFSNFKIIIK